MVVWIIPIHVDAMYRNSVWCSSNTVGRVLISMFCAESMHYAHRKIKQRDGSQIQNAKAPMSKTLKEKHGYQAGFPAGAGNWTKKERYIQSPFKEQEIHLISCRTCCSQDANSTV